MKFKEKLMRAKERVKMHLKKEAMLSQQGNTFTESAQKTVFGLSYCFQ